MRPHPDTATSFDWDESNEAHLAEHGLSATTVEAVWANGPKYRRNRHRAAGTWLMVGDDNGGKSWTVSIMWADEDQRVLRAITGWRND